LKLFADVSSSIRCSSDELACAASAADITAHTAVRSSRPHSLTGANNISYGGAKTAINEMSESGELEYKRAALQILSPILGELVPDFWKSLIDQWEREGRPGISPVDRQYSLDELSKMATEWLQTRNTLH
jgi:hypothetical protein